MSALKFYPASHRYRLDGAWCPGVTTILGKGLAKPQLVDWAAREVARFAADNIEVLNALDDNDARYDLLKSAHNRHRDKAAVRGTDVHALAEELIHGREVEIPNHLTGYVEGYARFLDRWQPTAMLTERPIGNRAAWYAGTFDAIVTTREGRTLMVDNKTSKRVYGETALQLAAYANAEFYQAEDGTDQPLPPIDGGAVIHITPTGTDLYPVADLGVAWKHFRHIAFVVSQLDVIKNQISEPHAFEESA